MNKINELRSQRAALVKKARDIIDRSEAETRDMNPEEKAQFDAMMADVDSLKGRVDALEQIESSEEEMASTQERSSCPMSLETRETPKGRESAEYRKAYSQWLRTGEYRDTILGTDSKGGYLVAPVKVSEQFVQNLNNLVFIRKLAHIETVTEAKALGVRQQTTRMAAANWTTEVQAVTEDTTMALGRRDLTPSLLSKLSLVSIRTLQMARDAESLIMSELEYQFATTEENAFLNGSGSGQPLGVFVASSSGVPTSRDVSTDNTSTTITADGLINAKYNLKQQYLQSKSLAWIFHRDAMKMIRKLKDGEGRYLWQPALAGRNYTGADASTIDTLLDCPVYQSEYAPNTFTTGLYVGIIGAFEQYWIAETADIEIQRCAELYAASNQVGYIGRHYLDGSCVLPEAFSRVQLA